MTQLFDRDLILNAGGVLIRTRDPESSLARPTLRVSFKIVRTGVKDPNTAEVSIYNLAEAQRTKLQEKNIRTIVEAGYKDDVSQIFAGELQRATTVRDGTEWITTIQSGDGAKAFKTGRISKSFKGPVPVERIIESVGKEMGVGLGNLADKVKEKGIRPALKEWSNGFVARGKTEKVFHRVMKALGYSWSIQDGQLQILGPTDTINPGQAVLLTSTTGLIGSPEPGEKGITKARSLLQPALVPGKRVKIEAEAVTGFFRIEKTVFSGDTEGGDWYSDMELKPL